MASCAPRLVAFLVAVFLGVAVATQPAAAHPQGTATTNRYLRLDLHADEIVLHYVVDWSEFPTLIWELSTDHDDDGIVSGEERAEFLEANAEHLRRGLVLTLDDRILELVPDQATLVHAPGDLGLNVLRVHHTWTAPVPASAAGDVRVRIVDGNLEFEPGWRVIVVAPSPGALVDVEPELLEDLSEGLTLFPEKWLSFPPLQVDAAFRWQSGTGSPRDASAATFDAPPPVAAASGLQGLFARQPGAGYLLAALFLAFLFGIAEALGPGHAKSTVSAYLAGSNAGLREAVKLSLLAASAHMLIVFALGAAVALGSAFFLPETAGRWLPVVSGAIIVLVGVTLLVRARPGLHHVHNGQRGLFVGISGGLVPCPSATLVMVAAVALGKLLWGFVLVAAFSLGTAAVLLVLGVSIVYARGAAGRLARRPSLARFARYAPVLGALLIIVAGVYVSVRGLATLAA